jgi:cytochrome c556
MQCWTVLFFLNLVLAAGASGSASAQAPAQDERHPVAVSEATLVFMLTEMRAMLDSVQAVVEASAKSNWQGAVVAAEKSGLKAFKGAPKAVMMELPEEFRRMGREARLAFDAVAEAAATKAEPSAVSAKLADAMLYCTACHQTYRFTVK